MKKIYTCLLVGFLTVLTGSLLAQRQTALDIALRYVEAQHATWGLTDADVADMAVSDNYQSTHNGVTHIYFVQRHQGIELYNGIMGIHVNAQGKVAYATQRFMPNLAGVVNATAPAVSAYQALLNVLADLGVSPARPLPLLSQEGGHTFVYGGGDVARNTITVRLKYQPNREQGNARLAWDMAIDQIGSSDYWSIRADALTGEVLHRHNWTVYCNVHKTRHHHAGDQCDAEAHAMSPVSQALAQQNLVLTDNASYNVFPLPAESPIHGERQLLVNPAVPEASPFGWHDTNGEAGPEYRITRGNNAHAYLDVEDTNSSTGDEPVGGDNLVFDFPFDPALEPDGYRDAAVTQLFYANNIIHDFAFRYGFDEAAGNFQQTNYSGVGVGNDYVRAEAQDGGGTDNANFATPPDGGGGRMQMYLWSNTGGRLLTINAPSGVAGQTLEARVGDFGAPITATPFTGDVAIANDASNSPNLACGAIVSDVAGKIAMIDRGSCEFGRKALNAQQAGAVGVIICNFEESLLTMAAGAVGGQVNIRAVFMKNSDCQYLRQFINEGLTVTLQIPESNGPAFLDGDFDNGIIAHEFGHGISNRLTGGPSQAGCLGNDEQMGEGWSDFFALVTSVQPGATGADARGIGNYAIGAGINGGGIRRKPYSTNFAVNDQIYDDIIGTTAPHPLGEVWTAVNWDIYWAMVDLYGWDADFINGDGGNNMAIQLIMDGMKFQACEPGFISGRDAILAADTSNYGGAHGCLIWEAYARRGLGWGASEGSTGNRNDGVQSFEPLPTCIQELKIKKSATELINAGDEATVTLVITNHKTEAVTGVTVNDQIPAGMTYVAGSATGVTPAVSGSNLTFAIGDMATLAERTITYRLKSAADPSQTQFFDGLEDGDLAWLPDVLEGVNIWEVIDAAAYEGDFCWFVPNTATDNDQTVQFADEFPVTGTFPVLRFYHQYNTEAGADGGIVQISRDLGVTWENTRELMLRGDYRGKLPYNTFAIPNLYGFWGNSNGYFGTYIDLRPYLGENIIVRWRFGTDASVDADGWYVDNIEIMDLLAYQSEACVSSDQNDLTCAEISQNGIFVESDGVVNSEELPNEVESVRIFPNPARDQINMAVQSRVSGPATLRLFDISGHLLREQPVNLSEGAQLLPIRVGDLPRGFYLLQLNTASGAFTGKVSLH